MQTGRLAKISGHTDLIVDRLERIVKFRSAQQEALARNWTATARRMVKQTAIEEDPSYGSPSYRGRMGIRVPRGY